MGEAPPRRGADQVQARLIDREAPAAEVEELRERLASEDGRSARVEASTGAGEPSGIWAVQLVNHGRATARGVKVEILDFGGPRAPELQRYGVRDLAPQASTWIGVE